MIGLLGLFALMFVGFALDASSNDDDDTSQQPEPSDEGVTNHGTPDDEIIEVGSGDESLDGGGGLDLIHGFGGSDTLVGGEVNDLILGEKGDDTLIGFDADDILRGMQGSDNVSSGNGVDLLYGEADADKLSGGSGEDDLFGGSGGDEMDGGAGSDSHSGGDGDELFEVEYLVGGTSVEIADFNGADDLLVVHYNDPADPPLNFSFTDKGGSGTTQVSLFGQPALNLTGNVADIGLTAGHIVAVNTAI